MGTVKFRFPPFGRKKFLHNTLPRSLNLIMNEVGVAKRTGVYLSKGPNKREKDGSLLTVIRDPLSELY